MLVGQGDKGEIHVLVPSVPHRISKWNQRGTGAYEEIAYGKNDEKEGGSHWA